MPDLLCIDAFDEEVQDSCEKNMEKMHVSPEVSLQTLNLTINNHNYCISSPHNCLFVLR